MASAKADGPRNTGLLRPRLPQRGPLPKRGFAINEGDAGSGVHGAGVYSRIVYLNRPLLFNCALAGSQLRRGTLERRIAPMLMEMVRAVEAAAGLQR